jgi:hypothetical protein
MTLEEIENLLYLTATREAKLVTAAQVEHFLDVIAEDVELAEHVLSIIQKSHGIGLELPAEPEQQGA